MQALFDDAQRMAPGHSRWMRQQAQDPKVTPTTAWLGVVVKATRTTEDPRKKAFVPVMRIDEAEYRVEDEIKRLTVKSGVFLWDLNDQKRYQWLTSSGKPMRVSNAAYELPALLIPDPDVAPVCCDNVCDTCPLWLPCRNSNAMRTAHLYGVSLSTFHFTKRGRYPDTKTWKAPGEEITGLGMKYFGPPRVIDSGVVFQYVPQFIKDDT